MDAVRVWDEHNREVKGTVDPWDTWEKVLEIKGFPTGLVAFLQTSTDSQGCGFEKPTIVQAYAWPVLQSGKDLVGVAKTGSGKTLAFLLPGFIKLRRLKKKEEIDTAKGPGLLAMTPTRELCYQIYSDAEKFGKPVGLTAACAYGGVPKKEQEWKIKDGPDCLIATPGRLKDFMDNWVVNLDQVRYAVLDEADRMLDMGFEPQIQQIMGKISEERQTCMFTATWPRECKNLAEKYIKDPLQVQIGSEDLTTNQNITQHIEICSGDKEKKEMLNKILGYLNQSQTCLVFCNTKRKCRDLTWELSQDRALGLEAKELHGDLDQWARDDALNKFRSGDVRVLVATDVAARGLDIRNISIVVNYDAPNNAEDYVHRIGRTGRAGDRGDAYTLISSWGEEKKASNILRIMQQAEQAIPQGLHDLAKGDGGGSGGGGGSSWKDSSWDQKAEKQDDWKKDDWKKDDWKKDDWKKDDWKKDDWKKDDWKNKEDKWGSSNSGWAKHEEKQEWNKKDDSWKKEETQEWKSDAWKKEDEPWKDNRWGKSENSWSNSWSKSDQDRGEDKPDWEDQKRSEDGAPQEDWKRDEKQEGDEAQVAWGQANAEKTAETGESGEEAVEDGADDAPVPSQAPWPGPEEATMAEAEEMAAAEDEEEEEEDAEAAAEMEEDAQAAPEEAAPVSPPGGVKRSAPASARSPSPVAKSAAVEPDGEVEQLVVSGQGLRLTMVQLKSWLSERGQDTSGVKNVLLGRIERVLAENGIGATDA